MSKPESLSAVYESDVATEIFDLVFFYTGHTIDDALLNIGQLDDAMKKRGLTPRQAFDEFTERNSQIFMDETFREKYREFIQQEGLSPEQPSS